MKLFISNDKVPDSGFIPYIVTVIKKYLIEHINKDSLLRWDVYLKSIKDADFADMSAYDILLMGIDSINSTKVNKGYEIGFKNGVNSSEMNAKLYEVCELINFGNLTVNGVFLFTNIFEYFNNHLGQYIVHYIGSV
jgi:galactitol-specific phosphotransferase system IIB component